MINIPSLAAPHKVYGTRLIIYNQEAENAFQKSAKTNINLKIYNYERRKLHRNATVKN